MANLWKIVCICVWIYCGFGVEKFVENLVCVLRSVFCCEQVVILVNNFLSFVKNKGGFCGKLKQIGLVGFSTLSTLST